MSSGEVVYRSGSRSNTMHFKSTANKWPDVPIPQSIFEVIGSI